MMDDREEPPRLEIAGRCGIDNGNSSAIGFEPPFPMHNLSRKFKDAIGLVLLIACSLGALIFIFRAVKALHRKYGDVESWLEIPAKVVVQYKDHAVLYQNRNSLMTPPPERWFEASYTYEVNGVAYHGRAISAHGPVLHENLPARPATVFMIRRIRRMPC